MMRRNGSMIKVVAGVVAFFGLVYFIYLYNDVSGQLKQTERSADRYRRESGTLSAQLQDLTLSKEKLQERYDTDKQEFVNRLAALNKQYNMLKSQHEETESQLSQLQADEEKLRQDEAEKEELRNQEYMQLKQEQENEVTSLRDSIANKEREIEQLKADVERITNQLQVSMAEVSRGKQLIEGLQQEVANQKQVQQQQAMFQGGAAGQQFGAAAGIPGKGQGQMDMAQGQGQLGIGGMNGLLDNNLKWQRGGLKEGGYMQIADVGALQPKAPAGGIAADVAGGVAGFRPKIPDVQDHNADIGKQGLGGQPLVQGMEVLMPKEKEEVKDEVMAAVNEQHQILPPGEKNQDRVLDKDEKMEEKPLLNRLIDDLPEHHQIRKPEVRDDKIAYNKEDILDKHEDRDVLDEGAGDHDNRIEHQGPVNLQVQEPMIGKGDKDIKAGAGAGQLEPGQAQGPDKMDMQLQPQMPVDDTIRREQLQPALDHKLEGIDVGDVNNLDDRIEEKKGPLQDDAEEDDDGDRYDEEDEDYNADDKDVADEN